MTRTSRATGILTAIGALALTTIAAGGAAAASISFNLLEAQWENAVGATATYTPTGFSNDPVTASWGVPAGYGQSSYVFDARDTPFNELPFTFFDLGTFTHNNMPIYAPSITSIDLRLRGDLLVTDFNDTASQLFQNVQFVFQFNHWETPNDANPCANGGANGSGVNRYGCADRVTVASLPTNKLFMVNGDSIELQVSGFSQGGPIVDEFWTKEKRTNTATLYAYFEVTQGPGGGTGLLPEPTALGLFGLGLIGIGIAAGRCRKA